MRISKLTLFTVFVLILVLVSFYGLNKANQNLDNELKNAQLLNKQIDKILAHENHGPDLNNSNSTFSSQTEMANSHNSEKAAIKQNYEHFLNPQNEFHNLISDWIFEQSQYGVASNHSKNNLYNFAKKNNIIVENEIQDILMKGKFDTHPREVNVLLNTLNVSKNFDFLYNYSAYLKSGKSEINQMLVNDLTINIDQKLIIEIYKKNKSKDDQEILNIIEGHENEAQRELLTNFFKNL